MNVTVVIPAFNAERFIEETLDCLLTQTYPIDEILIIDDRSSDRTVSIVEQYEKRHSVVRLIRQETNQGGSAARNRGLTEARNEWVFFMDADDTMHPDLLRLEIEQLKENLHLNPAPVLVHPAYQQTDEAGELIESSTYLGKQTAFDETFGSLLVRNHIITPSGLLVNREAALSIGGFKKNLRMIEDTDFILRLSRIGHFVYVNKPYLYFRRHGASITKDIQKAAGAEKAVLEQYGLDEIRAAVFHRNLPEDQNRLDFVGMLYRFELYEEGKRLLSEIQSDELRGSSLFFQAVFALKKDELEEAKLLLESLISLNPQHGASLNNLGVLAAKEGSPEKATAYFNQAQELFPGYMDAKHNLDKLSNPNHAEEDYRYTWRELRPNLLRYS